MSDDSPVRAGELQNYVGGSWTRIHGEDGHESVNPATQETLGHVPYSNEQDVDVAVASAADAFDSWGNRAVSERVQPLFTLKSLLEEHREELAETLVEDHGKTRGEALGELHRAIQNVEMACSIPMTMQSGTLQHSAPEIDESAPRRPLGVFAAVTPFNFPVMVPLWFLPCAVATGNTFVLKASEKTPTTAKHLFELIDEAGFPDGVVNLVHGNADTVTAILEHDDVEGVSFVGSTPVAKHIYETGTANGKRVQAQGGAKNHVIVTESTDLEFAAEKTVSSAFACAGERCLANDIAVVEESVYDEFTRHVKRTVEELVVGHGLDDETDIGPLITRAHADSVLTHIETGIDEGAELLVDGRDVSVKGYEDGNYVGPTLFRDVEPGMQIVDEEIFGPVLGLLSVPTFDEAIDVVNRSRFGNASSIFTDSGVKANRFKHEVEAGNLGINVGTAAPMAFFQFGGRGESFFGDLHAQGRDIINFYTDKTVLIERWPEH